MKLSSVSQLTASLFLLAISSNGHGGFGRHRGFGRFHHHGGFGGGFAPFPMGLPFPPPPVAMPFMPPPPPPMPIIPPAASVPVGAGIPMGVGVGQEGIHFAGGQGINGGMVQGGITSGQGVAGGFDGVPQSQQPSFQFSQGDSNPGAVVTARASASAGLGSQGSLMAAQPQDFHENQIGAGRAFGGSFPQQYASLQPQGQMVMQQPVMGDARARIQVVSGPQYQRAPLSRAQLTQADGTEGLGIDVDGQGQMQGPGPQPTPPLHGGSDSQGMPPQDSFPPQPMPPQDTTPSRAGKTLIAKGSSRTSETFSMQKSGSKITESNYEILGTWDSADVEKRGGRYENGRLLFSPPQQQIQMDVPAQQQGLIGQSSIGYQSNAGFFQKSANAGACGYVPSNANVVSLPIKFLPNACNRCVAIKSGNRFIKAVVAEGCIDCGDSLKVIKIASDLCPTLGVSPNSFLQVDWDFVPC